MHADDIVVQPSGECVQQKVPIVDILVGYIQSDLKLASFVGGCCLGDF